VLSVYRTLSRLNKKVNSVRGGPFCLQEILYDKEIQMEHMEDLLAEADAIAREAFVFRPAPRVPTGPVIIPRAGPVALKIDKAAMAAEKARTKEAATTAKLALALHQIKVLKAFIKAAGLKVPTL
jgi:hypothetical protein